MGWVPRLRVADNQGIAAQTRSRSTNGKRPGQKDTCGQAKRHKLPHKEPSDQQKRHMRPTKNDTSDPLAARAGGCRRLGKSRARLELITGRRRQPRSQWTLRVPPQDTSGLASRWGCEGRTLAREEAWGRKGKDIRGQGIAGRSRLTPPRTTRRASSWSWWRG